MHWLGARGPGTARLAYEVRESSASGPMLLCLHGNGSHRGVWRPLARRLEAFRCLLLDARGHGDSGHVAPPAYNPADHAADLAHLVASLALEDYVILGHSAGALAAAAFIVATPPSGPSPRAFVWLDIDPAVPRWQVQYFHDRAGAMAKISPAPDGAVAAFGRLCPGVPEEVLRSFVLEGMRETAGGWRMKLDPAAYATWEPGDLRPALPRVSPPTLVLRGADSVVSSTQGMADLQQGLPHGEVREIPDTGHFLLLEQPDRVAAEIQRFLRV